MDLICIWEQNAYIRVFKYLLKPFNLFDFETFLWMGLGTHGYRKYLGSSAKLPTNNKGNWNLWSIWVIPTFMTKKVIKIKKKKIKIGEKCQRGINIRFLVKFGRKLNILDFILWIPTPPNSFRITLSFPAIIFLFCSRNYSHKPVISILTLNKRISIVQHTIIMTWSPLLASTPSMDTYFQ